MNKSAKKLYVVPEPRKISWDGTRTVFNGLAKAPAHLYREFGMPRGTCDLKITEKAGHACTLKIRPGHISITGNRHIGLATLVQLVRQHGRRLPVCTISESLSFQHRIFHLDIGRGGVPTVKKFKDLLNKLYLYKYTGLAIYFEDLFGWEKHPVIGAARGRLEKKELRAIIKHAAPLGLEVFPSLNLTGHMENILRLREYRKYSEWWILWQSGCLDVSNPKARAFAYGLLEEVIDTFADAQHIHLGGDEAFMLGRGESLNRLGTFQGPALYEKHFRTQINMVRKAGKTPVLWGDMLGGSEGQGKLTREWAKLKSRPLWDRCIIANWDYRPMDQTFYARKIKEPGKRTQWVCPGFWNWGTFFPGYGNALGNFRNFLGAARDHNVKGFMHTAWGDGGAACLYSLLDPLLLAGMEYSEVKQNWQEKWLALSGEKPEVTEFRLLLGKERLGQDLYRLIMFGQRSAGPMVNRVKEVIRRSAGLRLPPDLAFVRGLCAAALKSGRGGLTAAEVEKPARTYTGLWRAERKQANLEATIVRLHGMLGWSKVKSLLK